MPIQRVRQLPLACILFLFAFTLNPTDAHSQTAQTPTATRAQANNETRVPASQSSKIAAGARVADTNTSSALFGVQSGQQQKPPQDDQQQTQTWTPLTSSEKMRRAFKKAFLSPEGHLRSGISAAITEWGEEDLPHKETDDRVADGLSRFAIKSASRMTRTTLGSGVFAVIFKQDPRYERSEKKNVGARALHAASRVFVTRGDNGRLQPNYSRWAGSFSASALSNIWERSTPGHDRIGTDATFRRFGRSFITDTWQTVVFNEFFPDLIRAIKRK